MAARDADKNIWKLAREYRKRHPPSRAGNAVQRWTMFVRGQHRGSVRTGQIRTGEQKRRRRNALITWLSGLFLVLVVAGVVVTVSLSLLAGIPLVTAYWLAVAALLIFGWWALHPTMLWRNKDGSASALVMCRHWRGGVAVHGFVRWPEDAQTDVAKLLALDVLEMAMESGTLFRTSALVPQLLALYKFLGFAETERSIRKGTTPPQLYFVPARFDSGHVRDVRAALVGGGSHPAEPN